jgi:hypothetical protein
LPMVKTSTFLYICDNLDEEDEKVIDVDACTRKEECEFEVVWQFLDDLLIEADPNLVKKVMNQFCQR